MIKFSVTANPTNSKGVLKPSWKGEAVQRKGEFTVDLGDGTLAGLTKSAGGEKQVHDKAITAYVVDAQAYYRGNLEAGEMNPPKWLPGMTAPRAARSVDFSKMSVEDIGKIDLSNASEDVVKAMVAKVQAALKAKKAA